MDYEELECSNCGHVGLLPNGGFDTICPNCGFEDSLIEEPGPHWGLTAMWST